MKHPTYCSFPFNSIAPKSWYKGRPERITPCCNMKTTGSDPMGVQPLIDSGASLQEIFESPQFEKLRTESLAGIRNPACEYCWRLEDKGVESPRITAIESIDQPVTQPVCGESTIPARLMAISHGIEDLMKPIWHPYINIMIITRV